MKTAETLKQKLKNKTETFPINYMKTESNVVNKRDSLYEGFKREITKPENYIIVNI